MTGGGIGRLTEAAARVITAPTDHHVYVQLGWNSKSTILKTQGFVKLVRVADGPVVGVRMVGARVMSWSRAQLIYNWEAFPVDGS